MDGGKLVERCPIAAIDHAVAFSMRDLPLREQGTTYDLLAMAENLWLAVKVYASGDENALHTHGSEDHAFIVPHFLLAETYSEPSNSRLCVSAWSPRYLGEASCA